MSDVWEYLPQVENAQNLYPNFSFTIAIVFTVVQESIKHCDSSKFHYHPALVQLSEIIKYIYICNYHLSDILIHIQYTCMSIKCHHTVQ